MAQARHFSGIATAACLVGASLWSGLATSRAQAQATSEPGAEATQASPPTTVSGVTITAAKPLGDDPKLPPKLDGYVRAYGASAPIGQLARWREKVCPAVAGLSAAENAAVAVRIKAVAAEVGAPVADETSCRRTVSVFFADQPQQVLDIIRTKAPMFLGYHYAAQTKRLATFSGVIRAWYTTASSGTAGYLRVDDTREQLPGGDPSSRISSSIASQFAGVVIVADVGKARGYNLATVADYVVMLALSEFPAEVACQPLPTIMNLFATHCAGRATDRLSDVDLAYLKALYATDPTLKLQFQQAELVWKMKQSLRP